MNSVLLRRVFDVAADGSDKRKTPQRPQQQLALTEATVSSAQTLALAFPSPVDFSLNSAAVMDPVDGSLVSNNHNLTCSVHPDPRFEVGAWPAWPRFTEHESQKTRADTTRQ